MVERHKKTVSALAAMPVILLMDAAFAISERQNQACFLL